MSRGVCVRFSHIFGDFVWFDFSFREEIGKIVFHECELLSTEITSIKSYLSLMNVIVSGNDRKTFTVLNKLYYPVAQFLFQMHRCTCNLLLHLFFLKWNCNFLVKSISDVTLKMKGIGQGYWKFNSSQNIIFFNL